MMFASGLLPPPPPILRLCIAVAEGWLLLDIGWIVLFLKKNNCVKNSSKLTLPKKKQKVKRATYRVSSTICHLFLNQQLRPFFVFFHKLCRGRWDLSIKFRWIPLSGFRGKVENISVNQRPKRWSVFSDRLEKHKPRRGRRDLTSW